MFHLSLPLCTWRIFRFLPFTHPHSTRISRSLHFYHLATLLYTQRRVLGENSLRQNSHSEIQTNSDERYRDRRMKTGERNVVHIFDIPWWLPFLPIFSSLFILHSLTPSFIYVLCPPPPPSTHLNVVLYFIPSAMRWL